MGEPIEGQVEKYAQRVKEIEGWIRNRTACLRFQNE